MGQATAEITITRPGMPTHELQTPRGTPHPLRAAAKVVEAMYARGREELAAAEHPWVGAETYFVGEVHGGDFYNRFPTTCRIVGTRRWAPATRSRRSTRSTASCSRGVAAETGCDDRARPAARPRGVRDRLRLTSCCARSQAYTARYGQGARAGRQEGRRRRRGIRRRRDPDRLPRPGRLGRARGRRVHAGRRARACGEVYVAMLREGALTPAGCRRASSPSAPNLLAIGGHPAVDMPPHVVEAAARAAARPAYAPTLGAPELREAIAERAARPVDPDGTCSSRSAACRRSTSLRAVRRARGRPRTVVLLPAGRRLPAARARSPTDWDEYAGAVGRRHDARDRQHARQPDRVRLAAGGPRRDRRGARRQRRAAALATRRISA